MPWWASARGVGVYERLNRTEVGLGKRELLSHRWGDGDGGRAGV